MRNVTTTFNDKTLRQIQDLANKWGLSELYSAFDLLVSGYKGIEQKQALIRGQVFGIQLRHFCSRKRM